MHWIRVTLAATDVREDIKTAAALTSKFKNIVRIVIYAEGGNNDGVNGPARVGDSTVDRVVAGGVKGIPLFPGIADATTFAAAGAAAGIYDLGTIYIMGEQDDVFQIGYVTL